MVIETKVVIGWFKWQLKMWLVDLNYNFECDWLIELSDNKLSGLVFFSCIRFQANTCFWLEFDCFFFSSLVAAV